MPLDPVNREEARRRSHSQINQMIWELRRGIKEYQFALRDTERKINRNEGNPETMDQIHRNLVNDIVQAEDDIKFLISLLGSRNQGGRKSRCPRCGHEF